VTRITATSLIHKSEERHCEGALLPKNTTQWSLRLQPGSLNLGLSALAITPLQPQLRSLNMTILKLKYAVGKDLCYHLSSLSIPSQSSESYHLWTFEECPATCQTFSYFWEKTNEGKSCIIYVSLYNYSPWVERGTVRVKWLAHNTVTPVRAWTRSTVLDAKPTLKMLRWSW